MKRTLKFRVWDKDLKRMHICGEDVHDSMQFLNGNACYYNLQNGCGSLPIELGEGIYELMQYTGLKDKNGKEIYESDIVKVSEEYGGHAYSPLVVDFKDCCFVLRRINYMPDYNPMFKYDFTKVYEVIGNIYQNSELKED